MATYFRNKRALATGIASCGSGIGALVMAPIISFLEDSFGWGHSMMLIGTMVLACIPLGMLFRPIISDTQETSKYMLSIQFRSTNKIKYNEESEKQA